jgi:hypothetical protein
MMARGVAHDGLNYGVNYGAGRDRLWQGESVGRTWVAGKCIVPWDQGVFEVPEVLINVYL